MFPDRSLDIDVVFDLMIHDLDVILALVRSTSTSIEAVGVPVLTPKFDIANARLRFATGCIANVTASRISRERVRKIRFFQPDAYLSVDYAAQEVEGWRLVRRDGERPGIEGGPLPVERDEPLRRELADFVRAVSQKGTPLVDGARGPAGARAGDACRGEDGKRPVRSNRRTGDQEKNQKPRNPETEDQRRETRDQRRLLMFNDLSEFITALDEERELARIADPVSPDLEICAVTDRVSKSPGGGPALLFERPAGFDIPVALNLFGSMKRICMALGVRTLNDLAREIETLTTPKIPAGMHRRAEDAADREPPPRSHAQDRLGRPLPGGRQA